MSWGGCNGYTRPSGTGRLLNILGEVVLSHTKRVARGPVLFNPMHYKGWASQPGGLPAQETQEMQVPSLGWEDAEKEMEARSGVLAWQSPWTEEPIGNSPWVTESQDTTGHALDRSIRLSVHWTGLYEGLHILFVSILIGRRSDVRIGIVLLE